MGARPHAALLVVFHDGAALGIAVRLGHIQPALSLAAVMPFAETCGGSTL